jgi:hypothetical protein
MSSQLVDTNTAAAAGTDDSRIGRGDMKPSTCVGACYRTKLQAQPCKALSCMHHNGVADSTLLLSSESSRKSGSNLSLSGGYGAIWSGPSGVGLVPQGLMCAIKPAMQERRIQSLFCAWLRKSKLSSPQSWDRTQAALLAALLVGCHKLVASRTMKATCRTGTIRPCINSRGGLGVSCARCTML